MNLLLQKGVNDMKDQTQNLIQNEMQIVQKDENKENQIKEPNIEVNNKVKPSKKRKKLIIDKGLSIRMYTVLFFHTFIITILLYYFNYKTDDVIDEKSKELGNYTWAIFAGCIALSIVLSFLVSKVQFLSKVFINYIFYIILLALNALAFIWGGKDDFFDYIISMLIMFDAASLIIIIFLALMKDAAPSTFWIMCSCTAGSLIAMYVILKIYSTHKYFVLITCILSFAIYESMNYSVFDSYTNKAKNKNNNSPSMISLPFELNISFVMLIYYILYGFFLFFKSCCCSSNSKKNKFNY